MREHKEVIESLMNGNIVVSKSGEGIKFSARSKNSNNSQVGHVVSSSLTEVEANLEVRDDTEVDVVVEGLHCVAFKPFAE